MSVIDRIKYNKSAMLERANWAISSCTNSLLLKRRN